MNSLSEYYTSNSTFSLFILLFLVARLSFHLRNPRGGKKTDLVLEAFFPFYMHFESKTCKVLVDEVQASCDLLAFFKVKRVVVYIKDTEEGKECDLFKVLLLVSCEFANVAR